MCYNLQKQRMMVDSKNFVWDKCIDAEFIIGKFTCLTIQFANIASQKHMDFVVELQACEQHEVVF